MSWLTNFATGIASLLHRQNAERELDDELQSFLESSAAHKQRNGMTEKAARHHPGRDDRPRRREERSSIHSGIYLPGPSGALWYTWVVAPARVVVEPGKESANAPSGQRHAGVASPVIEIDGIAVGPDGLPARKDHPGDVSVPFVWRLWAEDPAVSSLQAHIRLLEVEQSETETVNTAGSGLAYAVIDC